MDACERRKSLTIMSLASHSIASLDRLILKLEITEKDSETWSTSHFYEWGSELLRIIWS